MEQLSLRLCSLDDAEKVFEIYQTSPGYFLKVDGCLPTLEMATFSLIDGPKKTGAKYKKEFLIIELEKTPIGVLDLHAHHPDEETCYLGLLLIDERLFSRGMGRKCFNLAENYIRRVLVCKKIRLGVSNDNDVTAFWKKMGFTPNGRTYEWKGEQKTTLVQEFDKDLTN